MSRLNILESSLGSNARQAKESNALQPVGKFVRNLWVRLARRRARNWPELKLFMAIAVLILGQALALGLISSVNVAIWIMLTVLAIHAPKINACLKLLLVLVLTATLAFLVVRLRLPDPAAKEWAQNLVADGEDFVEIEGRVVSPVERPSAGVLRFAFEADVAAKVRARFLVSAADLPWLETSRIRQRDILTLVLKNRFVGLNVSGAESPFSYEAALARRGFIALSKVEEMKRHLPALPLNTYEHYLRRVVQTLGETNATAVLLAITIGFKDMLSSEVRQLFRDTGTSHVLVVSGFHVAVIYGLAYAILIWLVLRFTFVLHFIPARVPAAIGALVVTLLYGVLIGGGVPTIRAIFLLTLLSIGAALGRSCFSFRNYLFAMGAVLSIWPGAFLEAGFQLTFSAVAGLLLAQRIGHAWQPRRRSLSYCYSILLANVFAWLGTLPVVVLWFCNWVPLSPLINAFLVPIFAFICIAGGGIALGAFFCGLPGASFFLRLINYLTETLLCVLETLNELLAAASLGVQYLSPGQAQGFGLTLLALYLPMVLIILGLTTKNRSRLMLMR